MAAVVAQVVLGIGYRNLKTACAQRPEVGAGEGAVLHDVGSARAAVARVRMMLSITSIGERHCATDSARRGRSTDDPPSAVIMANGYPLLDVRG